MQVKLKLLSLFLAADLFIVIISLLGIYRVYEKADLPLTFYNLNSRIVVNQNLSGKIIIPSGDTVVSINGKTFSTKDEVEIYLDGFKPGSYVLINYSDKGIENSVAVRLINFYTAFYLIAALITGMLFIFIGILVLWKKPDSKPAKLLHLVNLSTASIIMTTWGYYSIPPAFYDFVLKVIFSFSYSMAPALFVNFTLTFPREKKEAKTVAALLYLTAFIIAIFASAYFIKAVSSAAVTAIREYLLIFNISRVYLAACVIAGLLISIHTYITSADLAEKKKLRWILTGFILGPLMFACLWVVPQAITNYGLIPEEMVLIFMLFIPATFAIAILKYHLFDIDIIIQRSVIYFLSIGLVAIIYAAVISALTTFTNIKNEFLSSGVAAVIIAFLFYPAKDRIQKIIDRKFFRIKYDFRIASRKFLDEIKNCSSIQSLAEKITEQIKILIPVEKQGFFLFSEANSRIYLQAGENFDILRRRSIFLDRKNLKTNLASPVALVNKVEPGSQIEEADYKVFKRWGIALVFPIKSTSDEILGFLVLGEKKSGGRFSVEDIDLLIEVGLQAGLTIERINIQEKLIREQLLKEKLQELSELKSFFLSSMSHELKTPLTSIRMFAELLHLDSGSGSGNREEYFEIIEGECDRLGRLIENVLDLSKMERGVKEVHFTDIDLEALLKHAVKLMSYQMKIDKCEVVTHMCEGECFTRGDPDLILSAITNLLSNGIKYSANPKKVVVSLDNYSDSINISFENNCASLSPDELIRVTEPYFRSGSVKKKNIPGSGIGLALVDRIMTAHKGKLLINYLQNNRCVFTLSFIKGEV